LGNIQYIEKTFGKFTVDRFADSRNTKVEAFNSRFYCPKTQGVNAFSLNWKNEFNWLCPPTSLIIKTIKHLRTCKARGVLLVPEWQSAYFWPILTSDGKTFNSFVKTYLLLDPYYLNFCNCDSVFDGFAKFRSIALLIEFS